MPLPSTCPECEDVDLDVTTVLPQKHNKGDGWVTRAHCPSCSSVTWADSSSRD